MASPAPDPDGLARADLGTPDLLVEALITLTRSVIANRRAGEEQRAKMTVIDGGKRGGHAA